MYVPAHFRMPDDDVQELLAHHGAGDLITFAPDVGLLVSTIPFVYAPQDGPLGTLHGHLARNNEQWTHEVTGEVLVVLRGPDAYVSPTWYASKAEHGRVVPTWDYLTVHAYGALEVHDDPVYVRGVVEALTAKHEAASARPWSVDDAPASFIDGQVRAVVGVAIRLTRVEAKAKASQNRPPADVAGVVRGLRDRGHEEMAVAVDRLAGPEA